MNAQGDVLGLRPELRDTFTDAVIGALVTGASGNATTEAAQTAATEIAAAWWSRGFALADVDPSGARIAGLDPQALASIARDLARRGESLRLIDVQAGRVSLLPIGSYDVQGVTPDRRTWVYRVDLNGPSGSVSQTVEAGRVLHVTYATEPNRPWRGVSPAAYASHTSRFAGGLERMMAGEASGPSGYVLPAPDVPDPGADDVTAGKPGQQDHIGQLRADLQAAGGGTVISPTMESGFGGGPGVAPEYDWKPMRYGWNAPQHIVQAREAAFKWLALCYGLPLAMVDSTAASGSFRDAMRVFIGVTMAGLARIIEPQLSAALDTDVTLAFDRALLSDVTMRARAVKSLVDAGFTLEQAAAASGVMTT